MSHCLRTCPGEDGACLDPVHPCPSSDLLRVVLRGISLIMWLRLLVAGDTSIALALTTSFRWPSAGPVTTSMASRCLAGSTAWRYDGGLISGDDARRVRLCDLGLRVGERFVYDYDLGALWRHDLRVEQMLGPETGRSYPRCAGGGRANSPEGCGGPEAFMEASLG